MWPFSSGTPAEPETPEQRHERQLAEGATRAATLLDRFGSPAAADEATAAAGEHWERALGIAKKRGA